MRECVVPLPLQEGSSSRPRTCHSTAWRRRRRAALARKKHALVSQPAQPLTMRAMLESNSSLTQSRGARLTHLPQLLRLRVLRQKVGAARGDGARARQLRVALQALQPAGVLVKGVHHPAVAHQRCGAGAGGRVPLAWCGVGVRGTSRSGKKEMRILHSA